MQIHWRNPEPVPEPDRDRAVERLEALAESGRGDLIDVWIDVRVNTHHRHGGDEVAIRCQARGAELVARRSAAEPAIALRDALVAFEREVHRMRSRRTEQRSERPPEPPHLGIVDRVLHDEGYGFLLTDAGERVYFHRNALSAGLDFEALREGQRVALNFEPGEKGPQATTVGPAPPGASTP